MKRLIQYSILLVLALAITAGILWARGKSQDELCTEVVVEVINADSTSFVTPQGILSDLQSKGVKLKGKRMQDIDASQVEKALAMSPYLEFADIVKCQDGKLLIRVSQLLPVLRVFDGESSYYVNRAGKRMDANIYYHSDVPVVRGHFTRDYPPTRLLPLIDYVEKDTLLRSLVTMYCVDDTNNIIIVPDFSGHVINIGNASGFKNKFAKLKLFYREVMPKKGWNAYDTISVKWNHQIVATRRVKAVVQTIEYDPEDDEQEPDIGTISVEAAKGSQKPDEKPSAEDQAKKKEDDKKSDSKAADDKKAKASPDKKKSN